ncbi:HXXEE domain-containing protein [Nonomuraea sp. NPDC050383]|uniref:HXXEE domain-containing protein n=1 Tax=Nonomuraea sp. NPDC050383 TaxID=3364362 RepID=UPI003795F282
MRSHAHGGAGGVTAPTWSAPVPGARAVSEAVSEAGAVSGPASAGAAASGVVPAVVTWGLLAAWAVHDAEELVTMPGWAGRAGPRLRRRFPGVPWERLDVSRAHTTVAIGLMGGAVAALSAAGARTGGRSPAFQAALTAFGLHGVVHLAQAAVTRGYTPGAVTAPLVVIPFTVWARRRLREAGVPAPPRGSSAVGALAVPLLLAGVHAAAHAVTRRRDRGGRPTSRPRDRWY